MRNDLNHIPFELDHIAYAVASTDEARNLFALLYPVVTHYKVLEKNQNVFITYLSNGRDAHTIELVEGAGEPNPVAGLVKTNRAVLYHLGYRVPDFDEGAEYMKNKAFFMVTRPFQTALDPFVWASHFFHPQTGIIEIMGKKNDQ